jgi:membrane fusion protein (multidrug efflux system)
VSNGTGTIQFACEFYNKDSILRPGGFGRVRILIGTQKDALLVPQRAVNEVQGQYQVVVVTPENRAQIRTVTVGDRTDDEWIITQGLERGDRVVVEGLQKLANGSPVETKPYQPAAAVEAK